MTKPLLPTPAPALAAELYNVKMGASAAERNCQFIKDKVFPRVRDLLERRKGFVSTGSVTQAYAFEIGTGLGVHMKALAKAFADDREELEFVLSDLSDENHEYLKQAMIDSENVLIPPVQYDARESIVEALTRDNLEEVVRNCALVFVCNVCHISPIETTRGIFDCADELLFDEGESLSGILYVYGPFNVDGRYTSEGNEEFDRKMREKDERFGIRDIAELEEFAKSKNLALKEIHEMPSNNFLLGFVRDKFTLIQ